MGSSFKRTELSFKTKASYQFIDLTDDIKLIVKRFGLVDGNITIQNLHTSAAIWCNENEPLLHQDLVKRLEAFAPSSGEYSHDDFNIRTVNVCDNECDNGHSHCQSVFFPVSITLQVEGGELVFGQWQRVMFIELDRPRDRKVSLSMYGEFKN